MKIIPDKKEGPTLYRLMAAWTLLLSLVAIIACAQTFSGIKKIQLQIKAGTDDGYLSTELGTRPAVNLSDVDAGLERIKKQTAVSFVFILIIAGFGFYAMNRRTIIPLNKIISGLKAIQDGNLDVTLNTGGCREIDQIESLINDISSNFQEILLLVWTHSDQSAASCHRMRKIIQQSPDSDLRILTEIASIHQRFREIRNLISEFEFYDVTLNEDKVLTS